MKDHAHALPGRKIVLTMLAAGLLAIFVTSFVHRMEHPLTKDASSSSKPGTEERMKKIVALMQHVETDRNDIQALVALAEELMALEAYDRAEPYWRRAVEVEPGNLTARYHVAMCLLRLGRYPEAADELEGMLRYAPGHPLIHYHLGMISKGHLNDPARARRHLQQALEAKSGDGKLLEQVRMELKELEAR